METERVLSPIVFANIANKDIDEAGKDEVRVFFIELTRTCMSGHGHTIVGSLVLQVNPLLNKRWVGRKLSICPFGTSRFAPVTRCLEAKVLSQAGRHICTAAAACSKERQSYSQFGGISRL